MKGNGNISKETRGAITKAVASNLLKESPEDLKEQAVVGLTERNEETLQDLMTLQKLRTQGHKSHVVGQGERVTALPQSLPKDRVKNALESIYNHVVAYNSGGKLFGDPRIVPTISDKTPEISKQIFCVANAIVHLERANEERGAHSGEYKDLQTRRYHNNLVGEGFKHAALLAHLHDLAALDIVQLSQHNAVADPQGRASSISTVAQGQMAAETHTATQLKDELMVALSAELSKFRSETSRIGFSFPSDVLAKISGCIREMYEDFSDDMQKNVLSDQVLLRRIIAFGAGEGAGDWSKWFAERRKNDVSGGQKTTQTIVLSNVLSGAKGVLNVDAGPGWTFFEYSVRGSGDSGRIFMARKNHPSAGELPGYSSVRPYWLVLIVEPEQAHQGDSQHTQNYEKRAKERFSQFQHHIETRLNGAVDHD